MDHNSQADDRINFRMRAERLSDGQTWSWPDFDTIDGSGTALLASPTGSNPVRLLATSTPDWQGTPNTQGTKQWFSHLLVAQISPADETFWIGESSELEGGTPGPTWNFSAIGVPASCEKGTDCDVTITGTVGGTATGTPTCEIDCGLGSGFVSATCSSCNGTCSMSETQCDYTAATAGVKTVQLRSTRESVVSTISDTINVQDAAAGGLLLSWDFEGSPTDFQDSGHCSGTVCATSDPEAWSINSTAPIAGTQDALMTCNSGLSGNLILDGVTAGGASWGTAFWATVQIDPDGISGSPGGHLFYFSSDASTHPCGQIGLTWPSVGNMAFDMCDSEVRNPMTPVAVSDNVVGLHKFYVEVGASESLAGWWPPGSTMSNAAPHVIEGVPDTTPFRSMRWFRQLTSNCNDIRIDGVNIYSEDPDGAPTPTLGGGGDPVPGAPTLLGRGGSGSTIN